MKIEEFEKEKPHPLDYLKLIWAKKWLVLVVAVAVFGFSAWRALRQQPVYEAMTTLQFGILSTTPQVLDRLGGFLGGTRGIESEIEVLKSRVVAERTAVMLNRHYSLGSLPADVSFELSAVGVTEKTSPGSYTVTFMSDGGQYQVTDPAGRPIGLGKAGQPFEAGGISFSLSKVAAMTGSSLQIHVSKLANVADSLRGALSVNVVRGTDIVNVRVNAGDPQEAARLANAFAETYVDFTREQKIQQLLSMRRFLEKQIDSFRQDLTRTAQALAKSGMEKQSPETILEHLRNDISGGPTPYSTVTDMRQELAKRLLDLEMRRAGLQFTYTPDHRVMVQLEREIADIRSRLIKQLRREGQDQGLLDIVRESQIKLSMYNYMLQRQQETRLLEASELGSARVIDRAIPPEAPVSPNIRRALQLGGVFGLALGIGATLLLGFLDRSVKNVQDLEQRVGLPAFGVIPQIASGSARGFLPSVTSVPQLTEPSKFLVGINGSRTRAAEAYRALRTSMEFAVPEAPSKTFLFTSAGPREGKSLTVANLAIAMSQMGRRVLVIDGDLRNPTQHKLFELAGQAGITEVLAKKLDWREVRAASGVENLDVLSCRRIPPNPAELLGGQAMREFLEEAKLEYDIILVDSPPVLLFTDACVLAPVVNGTLLVVRASVTTPEAIARCQSLLHGVRGKIVGAILNGIPAEHAHYGFYGYHRYYSSDGADETKPLTNWAKVTDLARAILSRYRRD